MRELSEREIAHWRNEHVGFIFQQFNLIPVLTAIENVELPLDIKCADGFAVLEIDDPLARGIARDVARAADRVVEDEISR